MKENVCAIFQMDYAPVYTGDEDNGCWDRCDRPNNQKKNYILTINKRKRSERGKKSREWSYM